MGPAFCGSDAAEPARGAVAWPASTLISTSYVLESDDVLAPVAIAEAYFQLYRQQRSAWTHEIDVRPVGEKF